MCYHTAILETRYTPHTQRTYSEFGIHMHMNQMKQNLIYTIFRHIAYIKVENGEEGKNKKNYEPFGIVKRNAIICWSRRQII